MPIEWQLLKKAFIGGIFLSRFEEDNGGSFRCRQHDRPSTKRRNGWWSPHNSGIMDVFYWIFYSLDFHFYGIISLRLNNILLDNRILKRHDIKRTDKMYYRDCVCA